MYLTEISICIYIFAAYLCIHMYHINYLSITHRAYICQYQVINNAVEASKL